MFTYCDFFLLQRLAGRNGGPTREGQQGGPAGRATYALHLITGCCAYVVHLRLISCLATMSARNPSDFLKQVLGRSVVVRLNSGVDFKGLLACLDDRMNIAMEQVEEVVNGIVVSRYSDAFIRGNNVLYISAANVKSLPE